LDRAKEFDNEHDITLNTARAVMKAGDGIRTVDESFDVSGALKSFGETIQEAAESVAEVTEINTATLAVSDALGDFSRNAGDIIEGVAGIINEAIHENKVLHEITVGLSDFGDKLGKFGETVATNISEVFVEAKEEAKLEVRQRRFSHKGKERLRPSRLTKASTDSSSESSSGVEREMRERGMLRQFSLPPIETNLPTPPPLPPVFKAKPVLLKAKAKAMPTIKPPMINPPLPVEEPISTPRDRPETKQAPSIQIKQHPEVVKTFPVAQASRVVSGRKGRTGKK